MLPFAARRVLLAVTAVALSACGEPSRPSAEAPSPLEPSLARIPTGCQTNDLASVARSYFSSPEQRTVTDTLRAMENECAGADGNAVVSGGWTVLSTIEAVLGAETGGSATDGAALANGVMKYMCAHGPSQFCSEPWSDPWDPVPVEALGPQGIFAVRRDTATVLAHGPTLFADLGGAHAAALWGIATETTWHHATGAPVILFYGNPDVPPYLPNGETSVGNLAFAMHTFPNVPGFVDGELHVGVCYKYETESAAAPTNPGLVNRLQREGTLLEDWYLSEADCEAWRGELLPQTAGLTRAFDSLLAFVGRVFLPRPLYALGAGRPPSTGGTPIDFSRFAPVAADSIGRLEFITPPEDGTVGHSLQTIRVQALSGNGVPMERVEIQLYVLGNEGEPAGATFCDPTGSDLSCAQALTKEALSGYGTSAEIDGATLWKAGGYTVCAKALPGGGAAGFTFQEVCAPMIHIKN